MTTYHLAEVTEGIGGHIYLDCTHEEEAERILERLERELKCRVTRTRKTAAMDHGEWDIHGTMATEREIVWWIVRELCERGWEPFAVAYRSKTDTRRCFRKAGGRAAPGRRQRRPG